MRGSLAGYERVTGIEPAWPAWKASETRSRLSVKIAVDLRISHFCLDRCGPYWTPFYRPCGPATAPLCAFPSPRPCVVRRVALRMNGCYDRFMRSDAPVLAPTFRSRTQGDLLALVLLHPDQEWTVSELARQLGVPLTTAQGEVGRLAGGECWRPATWVVPGWCGQTCPARRCQP